MSDLHAPTVRAILGLVAARKRIYEQKRDREDICDDDTLTRYEMYRHTAEAMSWLEHEILRATDDNEFLPILEG